MPSDARARVLERQRILLRSLLEGLAPPPGFHPESLRTAAAVLRFKGKHAGHASMVFPSPPIPAARSGLREQARFLLTRWFRSR